MGTSAEPFGNIDTPIDRTRGITGAIPVTGWALDDIEVSSVVICRAAVTGETPAASALCGGMAQFFVGTGLFIDGARPDVQGADPTYPMASRAGWGFIIPTTCCRTRATASINCSCTVTTARNAHDCWGIA